jgi:hypothetical protein
VAFEDDRDARATVPDHRHRCFAEQRPAPRALAHQEAYCLSSAFPVCPTFQDWARREAAAAKPAGAAAVPIDDAAPESHLMPPLDREPQHPSEYDAQSLPARRNPPRDWAAPPPWTGDPDDAAAAAAAGFVAADLAGGAGDDSVGRYDPADGAPPADVPTPATQDWGTASRGLASSAAYRLAGPDPDEPYPAAPQRDDPDDWAAGAAATAAASAGSWAAPSSRPAPAPEPAPYQPAPARQPAPAPVPATPPRGSASQAHPDQGSSGQGRQQPARKSQEAAELFGPAWEAPRRYEAYPTLRTRVGIPSVRGVPPLALGGIVLVIAAIVLFFFGPGLLGFGKQDQTGGGGGGATPTPSVQATASVAPTSPPPPTPQTYVVAKGDTFSKIAKKFGVTIAALKAANPQVKDINKITIGDQLNIPEPVSAASSAP